MSAGPVRVAVYGEVNANLIDGSSVWLQSVALMLASLPGVEVTVLLRAPIERDLVVAPLATAAGVEVVEPPAAGLLAPDAAVRLLAARDAERRFDVVLLRGAGVIEAAVAEGAFAGRLWPYYLPPHGSAPEADADTLRRWAGPAARILCQSEAIRNRVAAAVPEAADRAILLPPMIPDGAEEPPPAVAGPVRRLLYAGKLSPEYWFLEMVELLGRVRRELGDVELHVAGDKVHNPPADPSFKPAAEAALRDTPGLVWHGALSRAGVRELLGTCDVALSLRDPSMDASTEISTKVLEYGAAGRPVLLNRNAAHVAALGSDYPLLATGLNDAVRALLAASREPARRAEAARRAQEASRAHTFSRVAEALAPHVRPAEEPEVHAAVPPAPEGSPRLVLAGHTFKFVGEIAERARAGGAALREDRWLNHAEHDAEASRAALAWAEVVHCEWCMGNAVWYSRHKRRGQRLVVRFHRMELETEFPGAVDLDRVDALIFVARHVLEQACGRYGWRPDDRRFHVLPNAIEGERLRLPKLEHAPFTLGLVGYVPMLKRLDRALDVLERLRVHDDRYRLVVKGQGPWEFSWMAARPDEQRYFEAAFARIERAPLLRGAVAFEPFGDVAEFFAQVGWILSVSDIEGHAVALAEGMATGAVPVVFERAGAGEQYAPEWVHADADAAARAIRAVAADPGVGAEGARAAEWAERWSWPVIGPTWAELLGVPAASFTRSSEPAR